MKDMRKYILLLCALCAGLLSCTKENFAGMEEDGLVAFQASYDAPVRTVLNGLTPYWTPSEKITIFNGAVSEFVATVKAPSSKASFKGKLAGKGTKNFRAVTPYSPDYTFSSLGATFYGLSVPQEQTCVENSYDPSALVAIARSDDYKLQFKNLCSLVKLTIISDGVTSVTLLPNEEDAVVAGKFEATYSSSPTFRVREGKNTVTLKGDFKKGSTYYIVTLPATLAKGIKVLLNGSIKSLAVDAPVELARSGMVNLGELSLNPGESQLPGADDEEDEAVPSGWLVIGQFCDWEDEGAHKTYDLGNYYKAFDVPAASLSSFKFKNGEEWAGIAADASVGVDKWVNLESPGENISLSESGIYDVYLDKELRAFYVTAAGGPAPDPIPAPFEGKSLAGNFNDWDVTVNVLTEEGDYYVAKGLQLASTNLADPSSNGFQFVDTKADGATWYGIGSPSITTGKWYGTVAKGANICINGDVTALYDAYITKDMARFCVVAAGAEIPSQDEVGGDNDHVETSGTIYLKPNAEWKTDGARFAAYFFQGGYNVWLNLSDVDGDGCYECGVPVGYTKVIFARMNPNNTDNRWNKDGESNAPLWNQTADLDVPTGDAIYYVMNAGSWEGAGSWVADPSSQGGGGTVPPGLDLPTVLYLKPGEWNSDSPRFEAYFFGNGEKWVTMTDNDKDGVFEASVPTGMTSVIFVRMDPNKAEHSWDSKWNQTVDLTITSGMNCFTFGSWSDENSDGKTVGTWSSYTPSSTPTPDPTPEPEPEPDPTPEPEPDPDPTPDPTPESDPDPTPEPDPDPTPDPGETPGEEPTPDPTPDPTPEPEPDPIRIYLSTAWGWPYIWCWDSAGSQIFAGANWPGTKYHGEENGYYYWNVPEAYVGKTVSLLAVKGDKSEQTSNFNNVVLDKSVYFYLDWTSEKGCHLIQENK